MLALLMVFATCYGVLELAVLGSVTRTVRLGTLALAIGAGLYGCGMTAVLLQFGYTRTLAALTGRSLHDVVAVAGYTVDPVLEELIKVAPLLLIGLGARARAQWRLTDHLLVGAALGAGFGLLEALLFVGGQSGGALAFPHGWVVPTSLRPPYVPGVGQTLVSWLPAPYSVSELSPIGPDTGFHIAWSALAGLGAGMLLRGRGPARLLGLLPIVIVSAAHATHNFDVAFTARSTLGAALARPFAATEPLLGLWPLLGLAFAVWSDRRVLRHGKAADPGLLLPGERPTGLSALVALGRYAMIRPPYTALVTHQYMLLRRTAWYARARLPATMAREMRARMLASGTFMAWNTVSLRAALRLRKAGRSHGQVRPPGRDRRHRWAPLLIWAILAAPVLMYFLLGTTPGLSGAQRALSGSVVYPVLLSLAAAGLALVAWQMAIAVRALTRLRADPLAERAAQVRLRLLSGTGTLLLGAVNVTAMATGTHADQHVIVNAHVLDAVSDLLLYGGLALLIAGFVFFPPASLVALAGGGLALVPTITTGFVALEALGVSGLLLSQAATGDGGGSGDGGDDAEQARLHELGEDPGAKRFRQGEMETAQRVEQQLGIRLRRDPSGDADWLDSNGVTYDAVGNFDGRYFDGQWPSLRRAILNHLGKANYVPVDVSRFTPAQIAQVRQFIQNLGPRVFLVGE
jgi:hypothetical protein